MPNPLGRARSEFCKQGHLLAETRMERGSHRTCCGVCEKDRQAARRAAGYHSQPDRVLAKRCKKFGITVAQYTTLLHQQGGACAICRTIDWAPRGPVIDHCHATGKVRGILCGHCNTSLGGFRDNQLSLQRAIKYLAENS